LILVNVWQYAGMTMVVFAAGLQGIPGELYESAALDGADAWVRFRRITLPLLQPVMTVNVVTNIIGSLAVFDVVVALTDGGPGYASESLSLFILRMVYGNSTGYSTAVALVLFLLTLVPVAVYLKLIARKEVV
jgi:raffinose/stachyose/melibiose transport system permease protein